MREYHNAGESVRGHDGREKGVFSAYATPLEIRLHLEGGWRAYAAEPVKPESWTAGSTPIPARAQIESAQVDWLTQNHVAEVLAVFIPTEMNGRKDELFRKAEKARRQKRKETTVRHKKETAYARQQVVFLIKCCTALVHNLKGIPLGTDHHRRDPIVIQQLTEASEALAEVQEVMLLVAGNLLNGDGKRLAELQCLPKIDDQNAHRIFQYAIEEMLAMHHLRLHRSIAVTTGDLVCAFLTAIFMDIDDAPSESARIYQLICEEKPGLPGIVRDLILDHGHIWLSNQVARITVRRDSGAVAREERMYAPVHAPMVPVSPFTGDGSTGTVDLLDNTYVALALTLTVVEQVVNRSMQGERVAGILEALAEHLKEDGFDLASGNVNDQPMFASVLAAVANGRKVKPRGAVVAFGKKGVVPGGMPVAISLGHPDAPSAPYCLVVTRDGSGKLLPPARSDRALLEHGLASLHRDEQLLLALGREPEASIWRTAGSTVIGYVDAKTFETRCSLVARKLPQLLRD